MVYLPLLVPKYMKESLVVCLLFFERIDQTLECLQSFLFSNIRIVILNNGSSRGNREILENFCSRFHNIDLYDAPENLGVARGRNELLARTSEPWLLFVDSDIVVRTPDWLEVFHRHRRAAPETEVMVPCMFNVHEGRYNGYGSVRIEGKRLIREHDDRGSINFFPGGAAFVRRSLFARLGPYDPVMFVGDEDVELAVRALRLHAPIRGSLIHDIEFHHAHRAVTTADDQYAALTRYDKLFLLYSHLHLQAKHDIVYDAGWMHWAEEQMRLMRVMDLVTAR
ncbi:hypothetical protein A3D11_01435 [Candidatus Peribacteria bacterium RIFCSPHIGHO2_02_FULL_49_16]|nr:MAG: hypothetical protein A2880_00630 [Candidatus Peribacteria bacterium RIFCSPHIGHO2_01_FULL_49_38]OGJ59690.1 MAG: hypothetical protein A3D11_01435 [Candidatus Peribacteria bacterium RIFCSPHIGHO2_02_FULL_49_16]